MAEFAETKVLEAALNGDKVEVLDLLSGFNKTELRGLEDAIEIVEAGIHVSREKLRHGEPCGYLLGQTRGGAQPCALIYPHTGEWHKVAGDLTLDL